MSGDGQQQIAQVQTEIAKFQATWNSQIQPLLAGNPRVPAQFILDMNKIITDQLGTPLFQLVQVQVTGQVSSLVTRIAGIGVGPGVTIPAQITDQVAAAAQDAASTLTFVLGNVLGPLAQEAQNALATSGKAATVGIVISGPDAINNVIVQAFTAGINAWNQLAAIQELAQTSLMFRFAQAQLEATLAAARGLAELAKWIAAAGRLIYNSVVGFANLVSLLVKVAVVGGIGFVGYEIYKATRPQQNPARRRRRVRARSRVRAYLR